uniref:Protein PLANT CADMIUM RESISTANCE 8 n=2 Tax=Anthurium amnicola TaxID=1678845 RepID=A0A1D1Y0F1_9ARAE
MGSNGDAKCINEIKEELGAGSISTGNEIKDQIPLYIRTSQRRLLDEKSHKNTFLDFVKGLHPRSGFMKLGSSSRLLSAPSAKFWQIAEERDEISRSVASATQDSSQHFHLPFSREINWTSLKQMCMEWIKNPMNMALFVWILCVAISGALLFMVMTGMLNRVLPRKSQRDTWFEVNNQILNALFTLMCLYQHPKRFYHLVLLCRWRPEDVLKLRKIYCKNGTYKPHEWTHMMIVIVLLHLNCFAQYALCGLNLGYPRSTRPAIGVGLCVSVAIGAPAFASIYNMLSPLGKEYETDMDQQLQNQITSDGSGPSNVRLKSLEKKFSFVAREDRRVPEDSPKWVGGLFDIWDDISLGFLSIFCTFCVFGWNMDRLGFGNMYVHIVTFLLLCMAPFWIFNLAALNIDNEVVREALGLTGITLCILGLLYGGFWRIRMRKRFNLPANTFCCGKASVTDCFQWLCCCSCSLAQEVRTADFYDKVEDKFYLKQVGDGTMLSPLPREDGLPLFRSTPSSPYHNGTSPSVFRTVNSPSPSRFSNAYSVGHQLSVVEEGSSMSGNDDTMTPPVALVMQKHDNHHQ